MPTALHDWLSLRLSRGVGDTTMSRLLERFGTPTQVLRADAPALLAAGVSRPVAERLSKGGAPLLADAELLRAQQLNASFACRGEPGYPACLLDLADAPSVLWILGELPKGRTVSIVGTRAPDGYGIAQTLRIAGGAAEQGLTVISGGARGIDAAAHEGALRGGGKTVVVLGSGVDVPYPSEHRELFDRVVAGGGAVVSELAFGKSPRPGTFARRNRIIAALGEVLVVMQAGSKSGALITAREANLLKRPVLAVPGAVDAPPSAGVHRLVRAGAFLCEGPGDVLAALGIASPSFREEASTALSGTRSAQTFARPMAGSDASRVYEALAKSAATFDELSERTGLGLRKTADLLLGLELGGCVSLDRGYYKVLG